MQITLYIFHVFSTSPHSIVHLREMSLLLAISLEDLEKTGEVNLKSVNRTHYSLPK